MYATESNMTRPPRERQGQEKERLPMASATLTALQDALINNPGKAKSQRARLDRFAKETGTFFTQRERTLLAAVAVTHRGKGAPER